MKIDVKKLFNDYGLDVESSARKLFPRNNYPVKALSRVFKKQALLNSKQMFILADILNLTVSELYQVEKEDLKTDTVKLSYPGNIRIELSRKSGVTLVYFPDRKQPVELWHGLEISLEEYLQKIDLLIKNSNT